MTINQENRVLLYSDKPVKNVWGETKQICYNPRCKNYYRPTKVISLPKEKEKKLYKNWCLKHFTNIFWFICILVCLLGFLIQSCLYLESYFSYPTTIETFIENKGNVVFPGVTLCNYNKVRRSVWCRRGNVDICTKLKNESQKQFENRLQSIYRTMSKEERIKAGHQKLDFIKRCKYNGFNCIDKIKHFFDYHFTNCYTFNAQWGNKISDVSKAVGWNPLDDKKPTFLRFWIDFQSDEYTALEDRVLAKVVIHQDTNLPNPEWSGMNFEPGFYYKIKIKERTIKLLPAPYQTDCRDYTKFSLDLRTNATLDQESCIDECLLNRTLKLCGCTYIRYALSYDVKMCKSEEILVENPCPENSSLCLCHAKRQAAEYCNNLCKISCHTVYYEVQGLEILKWPGSISNIQKVFPEYKNLTQARETVASVQVFFTSMETISRQYQPKYQLVEVFSCVGGFIGLWLGISLLNILDYIKDEALCVMRLVKKIKKKIYRHKTRIASCSYKECA